MCQTSHITFNSITRLRSQGSRRPNSTTLQPQIPAFITLQWWSAQERCQLQAQLLQQPATSAASSNYPLNQHWDHRTIWLMMQATCLPCCNRRASSFETVDTHSYAIIAVYFKCVKFNARSVCNTLPDMYHLLYSEQYGVILITETWLSDNIPNSLIEPSNLYTVMRRDRPGSPHGGVCAFIRKPFSVTEVVLDSVYSNVELNCFDVHYCDCSVRFSMFTVCPTLKCMNTHWLFCQLMECERSECNYWEL